MKEITSKEFEKEVLQGGKVVVDFYSTECAPCEAVAPKFESCAQLYGNDIRFVKIFRQENRELANSLEVKSSPSILFFDHGKQVGTMLTGGIKRSELMSQLDAMITPERAERLRTAIKKTESFYHTVILGAGPAGLAAAIYLGQAKIKTAVIDKAMPGGQVSTTHQVSNYPGFIEPVNGYMLSHYMSEQARATAVEFKSAVDITSIDIKAKTIIIDGVETVHYTNLIVATGASPRPLGIASEKEYRGHGVSYCATCDAQYYQNKEVIVIGGGNSAIEESDFISKFASKITIVHQFNTLQANKEAQDKAFANSKISFRFECEPRSFRKEGDKMIVTIENLKTKQMEDLRTDGIFVFVGMKPNLDLFNNSFETDQWGYIKVSDEMETSIPGIYSVGDINSKKFRQITTAVADGTIAAITISRK
jgi:thioredoxin reductase (NADPH)